MREDQMITVDIFDSIKQEYLPVECSFTIISFDANRASRKYHARLLIHSPYHEQLPGIQTENATGTRSYPQPLSFLDVYGFNPCFDWTLDEGDKIVIHNDYAGSDEGRVWILQSGSFVEVKQGESVNVRSER